MNTEKKYTLELTERQLWFISCAIEASTKILPIDSRQLSPELFQDDYGISQDDMRAEIAILKHKINNAND